MRYTKHFSTEADKKLTCSCGCGISAMNVEFMAKLEDARVLAQAPFTLTSGYRCPKHPESLKNPTSSHIIGKAVDIATPYSYLRGRVVTALILAGFRRLGHGDDFIHVDSDSSKEEFQWNYYKHK